MRARTRFDGLARIAGWTSGQNRARPLTMVLLVVSLAGCSVGGHYTPEGPHPHIVVAGALHVQPTAYLGVELLHTPVSNAKPVTDLTVTTVNTGVSVGDISLTGGLGWQWSRMWGACNPTGYECTHTWTDGLALAAGATYRKAPLRIDLRAFSYDNSPVGARTNLPLGIEAIVLLFGFDL